jgi:hypothetical protein
MFMILDRFDEQPIEINKHGLMADAQITLKEGFMCHGDTLKITPMLGGNNIRMVEIISEDGEPLDIYAIVDTR